MLVEKKKRNDIRAPAGRHMRSFLETGHCPKDPVKTDEESRPTKEGSAEATWQSLR
jgi:hypothetical protein